MEERTTRGDDALSNDALSDVATPSDRVALENASEAIRNRLTARGLRLAGDESNMDLVNLLEAVERFELAVTQQGGDLMVDEDPEGRPIVAEPDDPRFVIPGRRADETVREYIQRIDQSAWDLQEDETI